MVDKSEILMKVLDQYQVRYNPNKSGEQSISCPNKNVHPDRHPSCSLNLTKGVLYCQGCGLSGDAYSIMMTIQDITFKQATEAIGKPYVSIESDFLL